MYAPWAQYQLASGDARAPNASDSPPIYLPTYLLPIVQAIAWMSGTDAYGCVV